MENLESKTQSIRDKAIEMLKMRYINGYLSDISGIELQKNSYAKDIELNDKLLKRVDYAVSKLEEANPDFKEISEKLTKEKAEREKDAISLKESNEKHNEAVTKEIEEVKKQIKDVEDGTYKIKLADLAELSEKMIMKA